MWEASTLECTSPLLKVYLFRRNLLAAAILCQRGSVSTAVRLFILVLPLWRLVFFFKNWTNIFLIKTKKNELWLLLILPSQFYFLSRLFLTKGRIFLTQNKILPTVRSFHWISHFYTASRSCLHNSGSSVLVWFHMPSIIYRWLMCHICTPFFCLLLFLSRFFVLTQSLLVATTTPFVLSLNSQ